MKNFSSWPACSLPEKNVRIFLSRVFRTLFVSALVFHMSAGFSQIYVTPDGTGDGTSENPANLQYALDLVKNDPGYQIGISLAPGVYDASPVSYVLQVGKNQSTPNIIIVGSADENGNPTSILDGGGTNQILRLVANSDGASIGLNIFSVGFRNGRAKNDGNPDTWDHGGAISSYVGNADSSGYIGLVLNFCVFENNSTSDNMNGGAIASNGYTEINDCIFRSNDAANGGAIIAYDSPGGNNQTVFKIDRCNFYDNTNYSNQGSTVWHNLYMTITRSEFHGRDDGVSSSGPGSCIWGSQYSTTTIQSCIFRDIKVRYWGSAIQIWAGNAYIYDCLFINNKAGEDMYDGYGTLSFYHDFKPATTKRIVNCTFVGNRSRYPASSPGGAIHNRGLADDDFLVSNCIFSDNGLNPVYTESNASIEYSCFEGSMGATGFTAGENVIVADPLFSDEDYRLEQGSPCVNTGNNDAYPWPDKDLDGQLRIRSLIIDMGCYEYNSAPTDIEISKTDIDENISGETGITFTGIDPDPEDSDLLIELAEGDGSNDADNHLFDISYNMLYASGTISYQTSPTLNIYVRATDFGGLSLEKAFTLQVNDLSEIEPGTLAESRPFLYPNPAGEFVSLIFRNEGMDRFSAELYTLEGKKLWQEQNICSSPHRISLEGLPPGVYLLHFKGKTVHTLMLLVR